jgi:4-amino-4-deoxy-L-arabinose transferase-like glycosyltransferase
MMGTDKPGHVIPAVLAAVTALGHLLTAEDSYGIFRDELYYVANGQHLDYGYVDHPALIGWISWLTTTLFGESLLALRLFPALAAGITVLVVCLIAREMGGQRWGLWLAGIATALAPVYVATFGYLSMNAFDVMFWAMAVLIVTHLLATGELRWWMAFGFVAGIALENKISMLFLGFGIVAGLLLTRDWQHFKNRWLWTGGLLALLLFLPYLLWQVTHDWATLEFMSRAAHFKNLPLSPGEFLSAQVLQMNPIVLPLTLAALAFYFLMPQGRSFRALGWACLAILALMILQRAKAYYYAPAFTIVLPAGGVAVERLTSRPLLRWLQPAYCLLIAMSGLALVPFAKPVLPVETFVEYQAMMGMQPGTAERHELERLPQFFADRIGWRELAETVAAVLNDLPPEEQTEACIFAQNYGQAGAIDFFGPALGLPPAISGHNSYWWWGPGDCSGRAVIIIGGELEDHRRSFASVERATTYTCQDCMPYENNKPIWVCREPQIDLDAAWSQVRHYN